MTFERGSNLSAEAAAFGGQPAIKLLNNGSYSETLTGDYAVSDTLPPSDQSVFWQTFTQISLNGNPFFTENAILGPESQDDIWSGILNITGLTNAQLAVLKAVLVNHNISNSGGEFDYAYNLSTRAIGRLALLLSAPTRTSPPPRTSAPTWTHSAPSNSISSSDGPNVWSLTFSATVTTIPEAPTWLMLVAGGAGLLVIRGLTRRPKVARAVRA